MSQIKQPVGQKLHTNIAIVSLKRRIGKKDYRFEIACYPNKILNWRQGLERDIDEVLQTQTVFASVSKGEVAHVKDIATVFGTANHVEACREILDSGHMQVSEKERQFFSDAKWNEILHQVVDMCVDPSSGNGLSIGQVQTALEDLNFQPRQSKGAKPGDVTKQQARDAVKLLEEQLPSRFSRANMLLEVECGEDFEEAKAGLPEALGPKGKVEVEDAERKIVKVLCHPSVFRVLQEHLKEKKLKLNISVLENRVTGVPAVGAVLKDSKTSESPPPVSHSGGAPEVKVKASSNEMKGSTGGVPCKTCNVQLEDTKGFREHCKSEWHSFNKKRAHKKLGPVDHFEFEMLPEDLRDGFLAVDT